MTGVTGMVDQPAALFAKLRDGVQLHLRMRSGAGRTCGSILQGRNSNDSQCGHPGTPIWHTLHGTPGDCSILPKDRKV